jgi:hypothetical protein
MGQDSIVGQSFILLNAKSVFYDRLARSFVAQMYILLILQSQYFKPEKANVFGLDVSVGSGWICAGLHPARKRSKGVWGLWKIAPN